ncbi:MAG: hypothetical protein AB1750_12520, partial [Chloroflexota bacterium]
MKRRPLVSLCLIFVFATAGCNLPIAVPTQTIVPTATFTALPSVAPTLAATRPPTDTPLPPTPTLEAPTPTLFIPHSFV